MMKLSYEVISALSGKTLSTAESCTGGGIGQALTAVAGASRVYKGGIISYTNEVKQKLLGVEEELLSRQGAVSSAVAKAMAEGARKALCTDYALSVTGLAGPDGDDRGNPVGTVYIGLSTAEETIAACYLFEGNREEIRLQAVEAALKLLLQHSAF